jgi:hypothetical protein
VINRQYVRMCLCIGEYAFVCVSVCV